MLWSAEKAELEHQRAEQERQRAEVAEQELAQLRSLLAAQVPDLTPEDEPG